MRTLRCAWLCVAAAFAAAARRASAAGPVFLLHVPKTGGTTVNVVLPQKLRFCNALALGTDPGTSLESLQAVPTADRGSGRGETSYDTLVAWMLANSSACDFVSWEESVNYMHHPPYNRSLLYNNRDALGLRTITFVRDPVLHFVSSSKQELAHRLKGVNSTLEEVLDSNKYYDRHNMQTQRLGGGHVATAVRTLDSAYFVGATEYMDSSMELLMWLLELGPRPLCGSLFRSGDGVRAAGTRASRHARPCPH